MLISLLLIFTLVFTSVHIHQNSKVSSKPDFTGVWNARILADPKAAVEGLQITYNDPKLEVLKFRTYRNPEMLTGSTRGTRQVTPVGVVRLMSNRLCPKTRYTCSSLCSLCVLCVLCASV